MKKKTKKSSVEEEDEINNHEDGLTIDEKMAVELYDVIKKKKVSDPLSDEEGNEEEESDENTESNNVEVADDPDISNTYNNQNEDLEDDDIDEKRAITYKIAKNKGLTPKRSKLQRNPRVKNRMKYSKALKRRKGAVREVREQNSKYGGEASGINMRVKKGVKFG